MEQFVLGIFQEQLSKFIVGFRQDQVNANLLNGKGEITNVELNCDFLNETLTKISPFFELERVHVSRLSFTVSSWANIRKAPILVDLENITAYVNETMQYDESRLRRRIRQISTSELFQLIRQSKVSTRGPYNLFDRILDNLTIEVQSIEINFSTRGKFKTTRPGPWTPPALQLQLAGIRYVSVNEYGCEATPNEVWRHNHHHNGYFIIYKKLEMEYQLSIVPEGKDRIPLILGRDNKTEVQIAMKRRVRDGEFMAVQVDATLPKVEALIEQSTVPHLVHTLAGLQYCFSKDRGFVDPLRSADGPGTEADERRQSIHPNVVLSSSSDDNAAEDEGLTPMGEVNVEEMSSSSDEEGDDVAPVTQPEETKETPQKRPSSQAATRAKPASTASPTPRPSTTSQREFANRAAILLPNGLVIHEQISLSIAIYHATVRGTYGDKDKKEGSDSNSPGHIQVVSKGFIGEAIWPKVDETKGGYVQASVAYVSVQERFGSRIRTLVVGGAEHDPSPINQPTEKRPEVRLDENFPLYEDRCVRPDPLDLRHSFPVQAYGLKTTIEFKKKLSHETDIAYVDEEIQVLHEMGLDSFDIVLDTQSWCRALKFAVNENDGGFDPRWHSGDWSECLTADMLVDASVPLELKDCVQPTKHLFLDENEFPSSDLFNMTSRVKNVEIRIPAAILDDVRSCDIVVVVGESMLVVSSALPRTFLSGQIGSSVLGDDAKLQGIIDFPNDPSDVAYSLERTEDPSNRQRGIMTTRAISTFRLQLTLREAAVRLVPILPVGVALEPQQLLVPSQLTTIVCFEGEPPESSDSNLTKIVLFTSILAHRFDVNVDFDLFTSAVGTLAHHSAIVREAISDCVRVVRNPSGSEDNPEASIETTNAECLEGPIPRSLSGRKVLVHRQIRQSRATGGLSVAFCLKAAGLSFTLWRQNVPYRNAFRASPTETSSEPDCMYLPLVKVLHLDINGAEVGVEATLRGKYKRLVLKACLSEMDVLACDISRIRDALLPVETSARVVSDDETASTEDRNSPKDMSPRAHSEDMVEIIVVGRGSGAARDDSIALRLEEEIHICRSWSLATDVQNEAELLCDIKTFEAVVLLVFEALLSPSWSKEDVVSNKSPEEPWNFPDGSVGALFLSIARHFAPETELSPFQITASAQEKSTRLPGGMIDSFLRDVFNEAMPEDVKCVLFRFSGSDLLVKVPNESRSPNYFGLLIEQTDILVSFRSTDDTAGWERTRERLGQSGRSWADIVDDEEGGLQHSLESRQRLISCQSLSDKGRHHDTLVEPFSCGYSYARSKAILSAGDTSIDIVDVERLDDFLACLHNFAKSCRMISENLSHVVATIRQREASKPEKEGSEREGRSPVAVACSSTAGLVRSARENVRKSNVVFVRNHQTLRRMLLAKDRELARLRMTVFQKEKERLSALAIVSSQVASWLRIGSSHAYGQRGLKTWTLFPRWCLLRRSLLIVYSGPSENTPVAIVSVEGAKLYQLEGGRRKRDLKRSFAIVESSGVAHIVVASTDREYQRWVQELFRVVGRVDPQSDETERFMSGDEWARVRSEFSASEGNSLHESGSLHRSIHSNPDQGSRRQAVGRSLTKAVQVAKATSQGAVNVAKATGQAVAERGRRKRSDTGSSLSELEDESESSHVQESDGGQRQLGHADDVNQNRRLQFRGRFAGVSQATKRGFGSALQAAKQKGKDVTANARMRMAHGGQMQTGTTLVPTENDFVSSSASVGEHAKDEERTAYVHRKWSCQTCTFLNQDISAQCDMCGQPREVDERCAATATDGEEPTEDSGTQNSYFQDGETDPGVEVGDEPLDPGRIESPEEQTDGGEASRGLGRRLGDAARSRVGGDGVVISEPGERSGARFSLRRRSDSASIDRVEGAPEPIRMRNVSVGGPLPFPANLIDSGDPLLQTLPTKRLDGNWIVRAEPFSEVISSGEGNDAEASLTYVTFDAKDERSNSPDPTKEVHTEPSPPCVSGDASSKSTGRVEGVNSLSKEVGPALLEYSVAINVLQQDEAVGSIRFRHVASVKKRVDDVLKLHTDLSEVLSLAVPFSDDAGDIRPPPREKTESLSTSLGLTALESVRVCGKILAGMMEETRRNESETLRECCASVTGEFLNSMLDCALPVDALSLLVDFLGLSDASTISPPDTSTSTADNVSALISEEAFSLSSVADMQLVRAENKALVAARLASRPSDDPKNDPDVHHREPFVHPPDSGHFREAMYAALMNVMEERDEAHARMVAAGVVHVHEMEQQQKQIRRLSAQLEDVKHRSGTATAGEGEKMGRVMREMQQDSEQELLSLCQQLASEISARTAASLEIIRLKESRNIEKETEAAERAALEDELKRTKALLDQERSKLQLSRRESHSWKESYHVLMHSNGNDSD